MLSWRKVKTRDVVLGLIVLVLLISGVLLFKKARTNRLLTTPIPTPSVQQKIEKTFGDLTIPSDVDIANMTDTSGGNGLGIATRKFTNQRFDLTILADLPEPANGTTYMGWLIKGNETDSDFSHIPLGSLRAAKGGYITDFTSSTDYSDYKRVVVTMGKTTKILPDQNILEGSF